MNEINKKRTIVSQNESNVILVVGKCTHVLIHFYELYTLKGVYQTSRQTVTYVPRADLGVGPGGHGPPPFVREVFFFCKRVSDGTSTFVT